MVKQTAQQVGHETRDVNVRAVAWFAVGLIVCAIIIHLALVGSFALFRRQHPSPDPPSRIVLQPRLLAPPPRVQTNPSAELDDFRKAYEGALKNRALLEVENGQGKMRVLNPVQILYFEAATDADAESDQHEARAPAQDLQVG